MVEVQGHRGARPSVFYFMIYLPQQQQRNHSTYYPQGHGPGSIVSIVTGYGLDGLGINLSGGKIFCTCPEWPWGPPSLLYNGYNGRDADPSPPSSAIGQERVELYLYSPYGPYGLYKGALYLL